VQKGRKGERAIASSSQFWIVGKMSENFLVGIFLSKNAKLVAQNFLFMEIWKKK